MKTTSYISTYIIVLFGTLLAATSCKEDLDTGPEAQREGLTVTIDNDDAATRSIVIDNPGICLETSWTDNDKLGVFGTATNNAAYVINASTISEDGRSATFQPETSVPEGEILAYYPYMDNALQSGDALSLNFPKTQQYVAVNGVSRPDPEACIMVGKGSMQNGIHMHNVMAALKVGQVFDTNTTVKSVEFRDLDGKPVCGEYTVSLAGVIPVATFNGNGDLLTLDLGEGVEAEANTTFIVFLVVPARDYPKGFEITFVDVNGGRTVKTVGTKRGKTLNRSVVHPVGDIGSYDNMQGMSYELNPTAHLMTPENLDLIDIISVTEDNAYDAEGNLIRSEDGYPFKAPVIRALVHRDLNPKVGGWLIFNMPSTQLQQGGIFRIKNCTPLDDGKTCEVEAVTETNFAAPFKSLQIGSEPVVDAEGNLIEDGGVEFDISPYVKEIVEMDEQHNIISRCKPHTPATYEMNAAERFTRGMANHTYQLPGVTLTMDDGNNSSCEVSARASIPLRLAVGVKQGELQYIYVTVNPNFSIKTTFTLSAKKEISKSARLYTLYTTGIPIGPVVLIPEIGFNGSVGMGGETKFSASTTFHYDTGTFGISYNKGQGVMFHRQEPPQPDKDDNFMPDLDTGGEISLYAFGSLGMSIGVSVYALCSLGVNSDLKLTFGVKQGIDNQNNDQPAKLHLTPEIDIAPYTAFVGGKWMHVLKGLGGKIELEPIWERNLWPSISESSYSIDYTYTDPTKDNVDISLNKDKVISTHKMITGVNGVYYNLATSDNFLKDYECVVDVYEGSGVEYRPSFFNISFKFAYDDPNEGLEAFRNAGLYHLARYFVNSEWRITGLHLKSRYQVGILKHGTDEEQRFTGHLDFNLESGKPYIITGNMYPVGSPKDIYDADHSASIWESGEGIGRVWYYWPNCDNGGPYPWARTSTFYSKQQ